MFYNLENALDVQRAKEKFNFLIEKKKVIELTQKKEFRTPQQNRYLHLILGWFALEYGETLEYIKQELFKKQVNKEIFEFEFINKKTGEIRLEMKSTAILDSKKLTTAIDRFRDYASKEAGIYLPTPEDLVMLKQIEIEINNNQNYI